MKNFLLIITIWGALYALPLFLHPMHEPDEPRYAEITREMAISDDWLILRINGMPYPEKPPMFFWLSAAGFKIFGTKIWVGRMVSALAMLALSLILFATMRKLIGETTAFFAAAIALAQVAVAGIGPLFIIDPLFSAFTGITVLFSIRVILSQSRKSYWVFGVLASLFLGCALLSKGPAAIFLAGGIVGLWAIFSKNFKKLLVFVLNPVFGCIVLGLVATYYYYAEKRAPGITRYFFVHENFLRYFTEIHKRQQPFWFFIPIFLAGMLPWTLLLPFAINFYYKNKTIWSKNKNWLLLAFFWSLIPIAFFSLSSSKLITYILLSFSGAGLFFGIWLKDLTCVNQEYYVWLHHKLKLIYAFFAIFMAIAAGFFAILTCVVPSISRHLRPLPTFIFWCAIVAIICLIIAFIIYFKNWKSIQKMLLMVSITLILALGLILRAANLKTGHTQLIKKIVELAHPKDNVFQYALVKNAVPFALNRKITSVMSTSDMKYATNANWSCAPNIWLNQKEFINIFTNTIPSLAILQSKHLIWLKSIETIQLKEDGKLILIANPAYLKVYGEK